MRQTLLFASAAGRAACIVVRGPLCSKIELARPLWRRPLLQTAQQKNAALESCEELLAS
jgi:hypothetical protein